ncbi:tRNA (guanine26-N2/guanine27-N2)-dimethyltransferase [Nematocida minor]|uniref:tRNA (guanine26-N2/guanine27-N2)-dimethyltransferase n=1 Tax=Nematocida minor TaxID=1912983 RepID=UPI00221FC02D|nr:tRNA (guanine26-N2/guanine27-N2)-dimethyltransferase [Nematocida minor]KAI5191989.1 tRNA (guanine26-N2/guanine27-N2)-dimethyltransferase [Nematocida minor]
MKITAQDSSTQKIEEEGVVIEGNAFYNPAQKFNRSLTIKIINHFMKVRSKDGIVLLECMSATGLRGIRYIRELAGHNTIVMNDISKDACSAIVKNCSKNGISAEIDRITETEKVSVEVKNEDCRSLMLSRKKAFDVIDIDPFGTCAPFIETAIEGLADNGLLCVTSTDTKVLCDKPPEACYKYYGSVSMNNSYSHEIAIRIVLSYISRIAAKSGKRIKPLVSLSMDFFIRVFVQVIHDKQESTPSLLCNKQYLLCSCLNRQEIAVLRKENGKNVYRHTKMPDTTECALCGRTYGLYGPFWSGPMHCPVFLEGVIQGIDKAYIESKTGGDKMTAHTTEQINRRIHGMLTMAKEEMDSVFYYSVPYVSSVLSFPVPPMPALISFLEGNGIKSSLTHCKPNSIKMKGRVEYIYIAVILYYRNIKPEIYSIYNERLIGARKDVDKNTHNLMVYLDRYIEENTIVSDFTVTAAAAEMTARKHLKFQDKSGLGWGPMKR